MGQFAGPRAGTGASLRGISNHRRPSTNSCDWQRTTPSALDALTAARATANAPTSPSAQPPLQEVLQGLDARELEGQTVFDQLFGPEPEDDPGLSPR